MSSLKDQLIRLGSQRPDLRKHLRPVIEKLAGSTDLRKVEVAIANLKFSLQRLEDTVPSDESNKMRHRRDAQSWASDAITALEKIKKSL